MVQKPAVDYFGIPSTVREPYTASVSKRLRVRVAGRTGTKVVRATVVRYRDVSNPYLGLCGR